MPGPEVTWILSLATVILLRAVEHALLDILKQRAQGHDLPQQGHYLLRPVHLRRRDLRPPQVDSLSFHLV